jgi:CheY-like chemotaxis protein
MIEFRWRILVWHNFFLQKSSPNPYPISASFHISENQFRLPYASLPVSDSQQCNIVLIDDDANDTEIFLPVIENISPHLESMTAPYGRIGNEVQPDLIYLDLNMPLLNGKRFLVELVRLQQFKSIAVIILSTSSDKTTVKEARKLGAIDFVTNSDRFSERQKILTGLLIRFAASRRKAI